jgi:hypothetical protein
MHHVGFISKIIQGCMINKTYNLNSLLMPDICGADISAKTTSFHPSGTYSFEEGP